MTANQLIAKLSKLSESQRKGTLSVHQCSPERPWQVAIYVDRGTKPVRVFCCYKTERDATGLAEGLREQAKRNGSTHIIRVERAE